MHAPENAAAIEGCLSAACVGLNLDISEIWRRDQRSTVRFSCLKVFASPATIETHRDQLAGLANGLHKKHKLSPLLCDRAMRQKVPLWYTPDNPDTPLHPDIPIKTAIVIPTFSYETQQEFYVTFFSFRVIPTNSSTVAFLRHICKAAIVACGATFVKSPIDNVQRPSVSEEKFGEVSVVCSKPQLPNLYVQWTDLKQVERLIDGGSSIIYTAHYNGMGVIVKILREDCERNELRVREIRSEIELMQSLNHPNIVQYVASGQEPRTFVVMERLEGGSLNQRLGFVPPHSGVHRQSFFTKDVKKPFSYEALLKYAMHFAEALRYMHEDALSGSTVLHRDLKPDNIGFKGDGTLKVLDFGLAKPIPKDATERARVRMTGETGSMRYMAPEVALHKPYDEKADVYSYSLIIWEMATLTKPFEGHNKEEFFRSVVRGGERPQINKKWPKEFGDLLQACWQENPRGRPSMTEVLAALQAMKAEVEDKSKKARFLMLLDRRSSWF